MIVTRRKDAIAAGSVKYFTGRPCKRNHISKRWSCNGRCVECSTLPANKRQKSGYDALRYRQNRIIAKKRANNYYKKNKQGCIERIKRWQKDNWESVLSNKRFYCSQRRRHIKEQTPSWANLDEIKDFYRNCPKGMHVDHVIPLRGKNVRGLHVIDNLQYLSASENYRKHNHVEIV